MSSSEYGADGFRINENLQSAAAILNENPPEGWSIRYENTGGGIMCILAMHDSFGRDLHDYDVYTGDLYVDSVYIGNADTYVGWDLHEGEEYGYIGVSADGRDGERVVGSVDPIILADAIRYTLDSWNI